MSPRKMKGMLKSMGIEIDELEDVSEVVIRMPDREIVIKSPQVAVMDARGVRSYQISGEAEERQKVEPPLEIPESDVELVVAQTGAEPEEARAALLRAKGDLAAAILSLGAK
ncbi:MAG: nascent polypeptide-associated complex protein [Methanothrix sp.]|nr:nascent polypeptide-associated complex protein [Methanothrix sp.]